MSGKFTQIIINAIISGSVYALIALGYSLIYGVMNFINFAHADIAMVGAFGFYFLTVHLGLDPMIGLATAALFTAIIGMSVERLAYRPLRDSASIVPLISAVGVSILLQSCTLLISGPESRSLGTPFFSRAVYSVGSAYISNVQIFTVLATAVLMAGLVAFLRVGRWGKAMRAVSQNRTAATALGINADRVVPLAFAIASIFAAIAGVLIGLEQDIEPRMGILLGFKAFTASVVGGIGSVTGAILGGLIIGLVENLTAGYLSTQYKDAVTFAVLFVVLLLRPNGLLGSKQLGA